MPPTAFIDPAALDFSAPCMDIARIRELNPQRGAMEQLTAVLLMDQEKGLIVGYKDVGPDEFWISGHMPGRPLMPGVVMCEVAAQLCSCYFHSVQGHEKVLGFGGMDDVRFRGQVRPEDRFVVASLAEIISGRRSRFRTQGFVRDRMVFHGTIIGIGL